MLASRFFRIVFIIALSHSLSLAASAKGLSVGIGGIVAPNPYIGSGGTKTAIVPFFYYEGERLFVEADRIQYQIFDKKVFSIGLISAFRFQGYDPKDNRALAGMQERKAALDVGLVGTYISDLGIFSLTALTDFSETHQGDELGLSWEVPFPMGKNWLINPSFGLTWQDKDLIDYYYGVSNAEARAGRPAYQGKSSRDWFVGLGIFYELSQDWSVISQFTVQSLSNSITDSPIVDDDNQWSGFFGVVYEF
ncbi:MAG: MipA/OmpV family protein [Nitrospirota bacterium]|nr:MipA/OmpV family protein [Nitrospirota bacterium]